MNTLLARSGLSIAIAVSARQLASHADPASPLPDHFFAAVVLGVAVWELAGPPLISGLLRRTAEDEERATVQAQENVVGGRPR